MDLDRHATDDELEDYSRAKLPEEREEILEEHLLVCPKCQDRLNELDAFVEAARRAAASFQMEPGSSWADRRHEIWQWAFRPAQLVTAGILAALLIAGGIAWRSTGSSRPAFALYLQAVRGDGPGHGAAAPAGSPLHLLLDSGGLGALDAYRLEIADARGTVVLDTTARRVSGEITANVSQGLAAGTYWVRLFESGGQHSLLREYGLDVR